MRHMVVAAAAAAIAIAAPATAASPPAPPTIAAAVSNPERSSDNVELDASRKPAEVLRFLGLRPGMHVLDLFGGNLYWAEITAPVIGVDAVDLVWEPAQFASDKTKPLFDAFEARQPNARLVISPLQTPEFGTDGFDFAIFNLNYHDLYADFSKRGIPQIEPRQWLKVLYAAMKPSGIVGVIDHVANPGDTRATANAVHRIDPDTIKADFESAGFVLAGQSDLLRNSADDHKLKVFDPAIRGKTDRILFKFVKPAE